MSTGTLPGWFRRRPSGSSEPDVAPPPPQVLATVEIYDAGGSHGMEIDTGGARITDLLNASECGPPSRPADDEKANAVQGWLPLDLDAVLLLIPPPRTTDPQRRLHRPRQAVRVQVGPYVVIGGAHVPPGTQATAFILRHRQHFVALTDASISNGSGDTEFDAPVVLVNLALAESIREGGAGG
jgi:hypothetical protein